MIDTLWQNGSTKQVRIVQLKEETSICNVKVMDYVAYGDGSVTVSLIYFQYGQQYSEGYCPQKMNIKNVIEDIHHEHDGKVL